MSSKRRSTRADIWKARLLVVVGLALAIYVPLVGPPSAQELVPAEGVLLSYSLYQFPRSRSGGGDLVAFMKLAGHAGRFWNDAVKNEWVKRLRGAEGSTVRVLYDPHGKIHYVDGHAVIKSWGLWINGVEIQAAEDALEPDRFAAYVFSPLFGLGLVVFGCLRGWYISRQLRHPDHGAPQYQPNK